MINAAQLSGDMRDVGQFHRAFDKGMAGQNLFQQRRSGPWQAEDEDRVCRVTALPCALSKERRREQCLGDLDMARDIAFMAFQFRCALPIAFVIMVEGRGGILAVLQGLAEREMEVEAVLR